MFVLDLFRNCKIQFLLVWIGLFRNALMMERFIELIADGVSAYAHTVSQLCLNKH